MEYVRMTLREAEYAGKNRDHLDVMYVYGKTGVGKTHSTLEDYGSSNCYRVTDYRHPFDRYNSVQHNVLIFEDFMSGIPISDMLQYLDKYPIMLPARYNQKVATYETVRILSNTDVRNQYPNVKNDNRMTWDAFIRRIPKIRVYTGFNQYQDFSMTEYMDRYIGLTETGTLITNDAKPAFLPLPNHPLFDGAVSLDSSEATPFDDDDLPVIKPKYSNGKD